ncbi:MAG: VOC family protein [Gemmatimonadota bacterium]|nr:VOC family protein [Gemmatimonadota bacterium]
MIASIPYLNFDGNCKEAITFYHECLGGDLMLSTFGESGMDVPAESKDRIVHARITSGAKVILMASDTMVGMPYVQGNSVSISVACESDAEVDSLYGPLSAGGKEGMAPNDAFWNARFAMFTDKFGFNWMLNHERATPV